MAYPESTMYTVVYGKEVHADDKAWTEWLAKYVIRNFAEGPEAPSRLGQAMDAAAELAKDADEIEMWRVRPDQAERFRYASGRPVVTTSEGLVAELVARSDGEGGLEPVPIQPPPPRNISPFPGVDIIVQD